MGAEPEVEHLTSNVPPEATTAQFWCKSATSGWGWLGRPLPETNNLSVATGEAACECSPSEETAPEKPCGLITVATYVLEGMEGAGTMKPPPESKLDGSAMERPAQGMCLSSCRDTEDESAAAGSTSPS